MTMIGSIFTAVRREQAPDGQAIRPDGAGLPEAVAPDFPPMEPLPPPPAANDDGLQALYEIVEEELRTAGYLR